jgi:hypothetical protein
MIKNIIIVLLCCWYVAAEGQALQPGFDAAEYTEMLGVSAGQMNHPAAAKVPQPKHFHRVYRSAETGLKNRWDLWLNTDSSTMVISLRGTTADNESWLENFYSAMIPATGELQLNDSTVFRYRFASDPKAAVHVGWTIGIGSMIPDILEKIKHYYARGTRQLVIMGHSQGAALAFLLTSYLHYQAEAGEVPAGLKMKTYCSAAPKPGNLYYAYDYDYITRNGWAFTIVNAADWVPETPFSLQTLCDFNPLNPFANVKPQLAKMPFFVRLYMKHAYNQLDGRSYKAKRTFEKYLGKTAYKLVKKYLPQLKQPQYSYSMNYQRAGVPIVLQPDAAYFKQFPDTSHNVFVHHGFEPYWLLTRKIYEQGDK